MITINKSKLAKCMEERNISSLCKLAGIIGVSPSILYRIWSGERNAGAKIIQKMINYFNLSFEEIFEDKEPGERSVC